MTGLIDEIDTAGRSLRIGSHDVEMLLSVSLEGLRAGDRAVVRGMRDPMSGRILGHEIRSAPTGRLPDTVSVPVRIRSLVVGMLAELCRDTQVLDCHLLPATDRYAVRIEAVGSPDKAVLLPRGILARALDDPAARRTVRYILQAAVAVLRTHRAVGAARPEPSRPGVVRERASWRGPRCVRCEGPLSMDDPLLVEAGSRGHLACPPSC